MKLVEETLSEISDKTEVLFGILENSRKYTMQSGMAMDIMQTLILAEYKLKDETVPDEEKVDLCEMLTLLFIQVTKLEKIKLGGQK